jgi:hypothetical protein
MAVPATGVVVGVVPLRNPTGEADRQDLVEGFTDRLFTARFGTVAVSQSPG